VVEHIAQIHRATRQTPLLLTWLQTPIGRLYVGIKEDRIAYIGIDNGDTVEDVVARVHRRLRRQVSVGEAPEWLRRVIDGYFRTWRVDVGQVDISDLTPFEQAALRAAAEIPPGEVRSYSWIASKIGRPKAARAVGQAMARNPLPLLLPCHRVVDASGQLHNYGYGLAMKARLLEMEGYRR
jgi:O-6-methylguanine DNA methyltransferase